MTKKRINRVRHDGNRRIRGTLVRSLAWELRFIETGERNLTLGDAMQSAINGGVKSQYYDALYPNGPTLLQWRRLVGDVSRTIRSNDFPR